MKKLFAIVLVLALVVAGLYFGHPKYVQYKKDAAEKYISELSKKADAGDKAAALELALHRFDKYKGSFYIYDIRKLAAEYEPAKEALRKLKAELTPAAEKGDSEAQWKLACYYYMGPSEDYDMDKAIKLLEESAGQDNITACKIIADLYRGYIVDPNRQPPKNIQKRAEYLKKMIVLGNNQANYWLADHYLENPSIENNDAEIAKLLQSFLKQADSAKDNFDSRLNAAFMLAQGRFGEELKKEGSDAIVKLRKEFVDAKIVYYYWGAYLYILSVSDQYGVKDVRTAEKIFEESSDKKAFARRILELSASSFFRPSIPSIHALIPEKETAEKFRKYLTEQKDPKTLLENKHFELYGKYPLPNNSMFMAFFAPDKGKATELLPYLEAVMAEAKEGPLYYGTESYATDILRIQVFNKNYEGIASWYDKYFDRCREKAYLGAALFVLSDSDENFKKNAPNAQKYIEKALKLDEAAFYAKVGHLFDATYNPDFDIKKNPEKAEKYAKKALELGSEEAKEILIRISRNNPDVKAETIAELKGSKPKDLSGRDAYEMGMLFFEQGKKDEAFALFKKAAESGQPETSGLVYYMLKNGIGTDKNANEAEAWRKKILAMDNDTKSRAASEILPGIVYKRINLGGDLSTALQLGEDVLDSGSYNVAGNLGEAYMNSALPDKRERALKVWLKAEDHSGAACYRLSEYYSSWRRTSDERDTKKAIHYHKKAMKLKDPDMYENPRSDKERLIELYVRDGDYKSAVELAKDNTYSSHHMMFVSECYRKGKGVEKNEALADEFEKKALNNSAAELERLGEYLYNYASLLTHDNKKAREVFELALEKGANGITYAEMLLRDENPANVKRGLEILERNSQNDPSAYSKLYDYYEFKDEKKAFEYAKKTSENSRYVNSYYDTLLAGFYLEGIGTPKDPAKAFACYQKVYRSRPHIHGLIAAEGLAYCYENGIGTPKDPARANEIRREIEGAVEYEDEPGDYLKTIADTYFHRNYAKMLPKDIDRAREYYAKSAARGNQQAKQRLNYLNRTYPALSEKEKTFVKVYDLNKKISTGDDEAECELALMYIEGDEVEKNPAAGIMRLKSAATKGNVRAAENIKTLFNNWKSEIQK